MKVVILAGGFGTRISEESHLKPKPMIEIGGKPILWHILKIFSTYGFNEFIICCGYKGYIIKEYFANYFLHMSDVTFNIANNEMEVHAKMAEPWKVTLVDTGLDAGTGGRLKQIGNYLSDESFCLTYGDGVSDINISELVRFHKKEKTLATVTAIQAPGRFGSLEVNANKVTSFQEKPKGEGGWINGGFFVLEPSTLNLIKDQSTMWEREPLEELAKSSQLSVYKHRGFWHAMDTLRDKQQLESLWNSNNAEWKIWK